MLKLADYAAQVGVVPQAVRKAIADGRIKRGAKRDGRGWVIDPAIANEEWGKNTAPQYRQGAAIKAGRQRQMAAAQGSLDEHRRESKAAAAAMPTMAQGQAIKTAYQAKLLQLEFEERSGKLVEKAAMEREFATAGMQVRDAVMRTSLQMVGEIASAVGGLSQEQRAAVMQVIDRYHVMALEELVRATGIT